MGDPRGWEALTQQEAEQDARARTVLGLIDDCRHRYRTTPSVPVLRLADAAESLLSALAVVVRERDQAREALRRIAEGSTVIDYDTPALAREIARAALGEGQA